MKQFLEPELKVELFRTEDIMTSSNGDPGEGDATPGINGTPIG